MSFLPSWPSFMLLFQVNTFKTKFKLYLSQETSVDNSHTSVFQRVIGPFSLLYVLFILYCFL